MFNESIRVSAGSSVSNVGIECPLNPLLGWCELAVEHIDWAGALCDGTVFNSPSPVAWVVGFLVSPDELVRTLATSASCPGSFFVRINTDDVLSGAQGGSRIPTLKEHWNLNPACLPVPTPGQCQGNPARRILMEVL